MKLPRILQFIFGCRHRHLSRVFTIKHRTYRVCFDCGREFDLPGLNPLTRSGIAKHAGPMRDPGMQAEVTRFRPAHNRNLNLNLSM